MEELLRSHPTEAETALAALEERLKEAVVASEGGGQTEERCIPQEALSLLTNHVEQIARAKVEQSHIADHLNESFNGEIMGMGRAKFIDETVILMAP